MFNIQFNSNTVRFIIKTSYNMKWQLFGGVGLTIVTFRTLINIFRFMGCRSNWCIENKYLLHPCYGLWYVGWVKRPAFVLSGPDLTHSADKKNIISTLTNKLRIQFRVQYSPSYVTKCSFRLLRNLFLLYSVNVLISCPRHCNRSTLVFALLVNPKLVKRAFKRNSVKN